MSSAPSDAGIAGAPCITASDAEIDGAPFKTASDPGIAGAPLDTGSDPKIEGLPGSTASCPAADAAPGIAPDISSAEDGSPGMALDAERDGALCVNVPDADIAAAASPGGEAVAGAEKPPLKAPLVDIPGAAAPDCAAMDGKSDAVGKPPFVEDAAETRCAASLAADAVALSRLPAPAASDAINAAFGSAVGRAVVSSLPDSTCALPAFESWGGSAGPAALSEARVPADGKEVAVE